MEERHRIGLDEAKTIVFCESIGHAEEMAELLGGVTYHSELDKDEKAAILSDFRSGGHQVICAVDMFNNPKSTASGCGQPPFGRFTVRTHDCA
jgi:superfamily II DNA or RNA helicase